jgi:periplasmic protein TonB
VRGSYDVPVRTRALLWIWLSCASACERADAGSNARKTALPRDEPEARLAFVLPTPAEGPAPPPAPAAVLPAPRRVVVAPSPPKRERPVPAPVETAAPPPVEVELPVPPPPAPPPPPPPPRRPPQNLPDGAQPATPSPSNAAPEFPAAARGRGLEGVVALKIVVTASGSVGEIRVLKGEEPFVRAAVSAVRQWRYTPARFQGEAIAVWKIVKVPFRLR